LELPLSQNLDKTSSKFRNTSGRRGRDLPKLVLISIDLYHIPLF
jgi:hypothetical protein